MDEKTYSEHKELLRWLSAPQVADDLKDELLAVSDNDAAIKERFGKAMQFGTAGLRSKMGAGISRMNVLTVAQTTQALSKLIIDAGGAERGCVIAYDSRNDSVLFSKTAAGVLAANGVKTYFFDALRPTPELSFAILHLNAIAGINITASHNTKEYNGYKVYWEDGAQLSPDHARTISDESARTDVLTGAKHMPFDSAVSKGLIKILGRSVDDAFAAAVLSSRICPELTEQYGDMLNIVYTPLHGSGCRLVPEVLRLAGATNLRIVPEQAEPDGNFPTVVSPNPENANALSMAVAMASGAKQKCMLVLGTDPDSDRIGAAVREDDGTYTVLSGNQMGALLLDYIIKGRRLHGALPENACAIRSVVSSDLFSRIAESNGVSAVEVLTGFKYIGEKIKEYEQTNEHTFILGYEESHGYLAGTYARDKDAVEGCMLLTECAAYHLSHGRTLTQALKAIYEEYGYYLEETLTFSMTPEDAAALMEKLRFDAPHSLGSSKVKLLCDYSICKRTELPSGVTSATGLPQTNMLGFETDGGCRLIFRPSGTEPKIKAYVLVCGKTQDEAQEELENFENAAKKLLQG